MSIDINGIANGLGSTASGLYNQVQGLLNSGDLSDPGTQAKLQALDLQLQGVEQCMNQFFETMSNLLKTQGDTADNTIHNTAI
jgi:hypothetical protein